MKRDIRVRFAPSPTGPLHLGGVRTALFNYLFAKKNQGTFILRIEDTDRSRFVPGAEAYITESLKWANIHYDEGPDKGGLYAPYRQSERTFLYKEYIAKLLDEGNAYYAFDTPEELEILRKNVLTNPASQFQYDSSIRMNLRNSLSLPAEEVKKMLQSRTPYVVRIRIPENETVNFTDLIRGEVSVHTSNLDDKVLFKSDGLPTYHLANVVDDYLMKISHVIRGEEWLPSAPLHKLLYRFLGLAHSMPEFAHLPLILKPDGHGKLSKRDGDRLGFPVFPINWTDPSTGEKYAGYREAGYLPEAFINMLALLGWNPGTTQELFTMEELIEAFSLDRVHKAGSRFDPEKAKWYNHHYIQLLSDTKLADRLMHDAAGTPQGTNRSYALRIIPLIRERITVLTDIWAQGRFFYSDPEEFDHQITAKVWQAETPGIILEFNSTVSLLEHWTKDELQAVVHQFVTQRGIKTGQLLNPLRLLLVGSNQGPGLLDIAEILGKETFLRRIQKTPV